MKLSSTTRDHTTIKPYGSWIDLLRGREKFLLDQTPYIGVFSNSARSCPQTTTYVYYVKFLEL